MLHALLIILRVIGIILLIVAAVLILLILAVLFVPVRYRVNVKKDVGPFTAGAEASWLLKALRVEVSWTAGGGRADIRFLRFTLKTFRLPGVGKKEYQDEEAQKSGEGNPSGNNSDTVSPEKQTETHDQGRPEAQGSVEIETDREPCRAENASEDHIGTHKPYKNAEAGDDSSDTEEHRGEGLFEKAAERLKKAAGMLFEILLQIPGFPAEVLNYVQEKADEIDKKIEALKKKAGPFLTAQADHVYLEIIDCVKYLLRGWKIRRAEGYLTFGTGSPDTTGILTGLVYAALPTDSGSYSVNPDFYESCFETDTTLAGRARMYRLAYAAIRLFRDKEFRRMLRKIRGSDTGRRRKNNSRR